MHLHIVIVKQIRTLVRNIKTCSLLTLGCTAIDKRRAQGYIINYLLAISFVINRSVMQLPGNSKKNDKAMEKIVRRHTAMSAKNSQCNKFSAFLMVENY